MRKFHSKFWFPFTIIFVLVFEFIFIINDYYVLKILRSHCKTFVCKLAETVCAMETKDDLVVGLQRAGSSSGILKRENESTCMFFQKHP